MNVLLRDCDGGDVAVQNSGLYPNIRLYMVPQTGSFAGVWEQSNPTNTPDWSGVGFFFARELSTRMARSVPIGLIQVAKNGTLISNWTTYSGGSSGKLYKDNIKPLQPFAIRGVLWYQGEADGSRESDALNYYKMLPGLISEWRRDWGQGEFPFYYVQLAPIDGRPNWAIVRDAQVSTLSVPNTAMACIIDIPTVPSTEIHPPAKEPVGERLALVARALIYDETDLAYSGPIRDRATHSLQDSSTVVIGFKHTEGGLFTDSGYLTNAGLITDDGLSPGPFMIAGDDGVYYEAGAEIAGNAVVVSNPVWVPNPKSVRYCWGSYPVCNLFNAANGAPYLPASPFQLTIERTP
jgi:sialate O-acetylesterase